MLVQGVDFVYMPVKDFEAAKEFYGTVLGLPQTAQYGSHPAASGRRAT